MKPKPLPIVFFEFCSGLFVLLAVGADLISLGERAIFFVLLAILCRLMVIEGAIIYSGRK